MHKLRSLLLCNYELADAATRCELCEVCTQNIAAHHLQPDLMLVNVFLPWRLEHMIANLMRKQGAHKGSRAKCMTSRGRWQGESTC
jgi:hypothetical protein